MTCNLCGVEDRQAYRGYNARNYGVNYEGFEHPLSPHFVKDGNSSPVHPQPGGIGYRHWLGLVESSADGERKPAKVVERFRFLREEGRLWAFGYDMDNMKARCWYDATMPLLSVTEEARPFFRAWTEQLIQAANIVVKTVRRRVKDALFGKSKVRGDISFVEVHFRQSTEGAFYDSAYRLKDIAILNKGEQEVMKNWLSLLQNRALVTFDHFAQTGDFDARDPRRSTLARNGLAKDLRGKKLRRVLGLPSRNTNRS